MNVSHGAGLLGRLQDRYSQVIQFLHGHSDNYVHILITKSNVFKLGVGFLPILPVIFRFTRSEGRLGREVCPIWGVM